MVVGGRFGSGEAGYGSAEELAYYDAAFGILMLIMGMHEAFVTTPLTFFNHRKKSTDEQKFAGKMLFLSLVFSVVALAATIATVLYQYLVFNVSHAFLLAMIGLVILVPFQAVKEFSRRWLLANMNVRQSTMLEFGFASCFIVLMAGLVLLAKVNAATVLGLTAAANFLCLIAWWKIYGKSFSLDSGGVKTQAVENYRYGKWVAAENVCSVIMMFFSQWFLISQIGVIEAGVYSACVTIVFLSNPFLLGVSSVFAPRSAQVFAEEGWRGLGVLLSQYAVLVTVVLVGFSGVLYFFGGQLTELAFGDQYSEYFAVHSGGKNSLTFILSLAMPCFGISFLVTCCILAANRPVFCFYGALAGMIVSVGANFMFATPTPYTAAISFVMGAFATMMFRVFVVYYLFRNDRRRRLASIRTE